MKHFKELLNKSNYNRLKIFYNLSELEEITGLSTRALKYRMLDVKKKYSGVTSLLTKKNRQWQIHYSIIREFEPKYNLKNQTIYSYDWTTMATWNPLSNYDVQYHIQLINEVKQQLANHTILYSVELDERGINHTHIISNANSDELQKAVTSIITRYMDNTKECKILIEPIYNKYNSVKYLMKAPLASKILY
jgi:hypothetical protein